jgi:hypothetical protein
MPDTPTQTLVPVTKAAALRYLLECVENGYHHHISGTLPAKKLPAFIAKMQERYSTNASRGARAYARKKGRACSRLVVYPLANATGDWQYFLLATDGMGAVHTSEQLKDARKPGECVQWFERYSDGISRPQYVLQGRPVRASTGPTHRWTWSMTDTLYLTMQAWIGKGADRVRSSGAKNPANLVAAIEALRKMPGFKGVREQKRRLIVEAGIPSEFSPSLIAPEIGGYVDKKLPVFEPTNSVERILGN